MAQRIQAQIQQAKTSDQSVRQIVTSVLTDQAKESTESTGQNQTIVRENTDAQKVYEESVRAVEAKNAKAQADYEAEKAKIAEENAQAQREYEAKKAKVEADNANNKKAYEEAIKRIAAENKQAQDAYQANRQKPKLNSTPKNGLIPRSLRMRKLQALRFVLLKRLIKEL